MKTKKIYEDFFDEISNDDIQDNSDDLIQQKFEYKLVLYVPVSFRPQNYTGIKELPVTEFLKRASFIISKMTCFYFDMKNVRYLYRIRDEKVKMYYSIDTFKEFDDISQETVSKNLIDEINKVFNEYFKNIDWKSPDNENRTIHLARYFLAVEVPFKLNHNAKYKNLVKEFNQLSNLTVNYCNMFNILSNELTVLANYEFYKDGERIKDIFDDYTTRITDWDLYSYHDVFAYFYEPCEDEIYKIPTDKFEVKTNFEFLNMLINYGDKKIQNEMAEQFDIDYYGLDNSYHDSALFAFRFHMKDPKKLTEVKKLDELIKKYIIHGVSNKSKMKLMNACASGHQFEMTMYFILDDLIIDDYPDYKPLYKDVIIKDESGNPIYTINWYIYYYDAEFNKFKEKRTTAFEKQAIESKIDKIRRACNR